MYSESRQSAAHDIVDVVSGQSVQVLSEPGSCWYCRRLHGFRVVVLWCRRSARPRQWLCRTQLPRLRRRLSVALLCLLVRRR